MPALSSAEKDFLLKIAYAAIRQSLTGNARSETPALNSLGREIRAGCFVTLKKEGKLRGCIGSFESNELLEVEVTRMARASAFEDPRFEPVQKEDLPGMEIEISVLGPLKKIRHIQDIEIGKHGILVKTKFRRGTYLPEVALEQGWDAENFFLHCARHKAGIPENDLSAAEIFIYEVDQFRGPDPAAEACP